MSQPPIGTAQRTPTVAPPDPSTTEPARAEDLRSHLVDTLVAGGHLTTHRWRAAFRSVPRERFFVRFTLPSAHGFGDYDLTDAEHSGVALAAVHTDNELTVRSRPSGAGNGLSPAPSLLARMFEHLAVRPGDRVLEVGTSGGYHAALLCEVIGDSHVTSLDPDGEAAEAARSALATSEHHPAVVSGAPHLGFAPEAPYDRVLATGGAGRVPPDWVNQLRTGGVLVAPVSSGVARLTAREDGSADGQFLCSAGFAPLRASVDAPHLEHADVMAITAGTGVSHDAPAIPRGIFTDPAVQFLFTLHHPTLRQVVLDTAAGTEYRLHDPAHDCWARVRPNGPGRVSVARGGRPGDLWRDLSSLVVTWNEHGRPRIDRYGLTVRPDGTHLLWLDERAHPVAALPG